MYKFTFEIGTGVYNSMHALQLGLLAARNKGVSIAKAGVAKLKLPEKLLRIDSRL